MHHGQPFSSFQPGHYATQAGGGAGGSGSRRASLSRDELLHAVAMVGAVLGAADEARFALEHRPVGVRAAQLPDREVIDSLAYLHVDLAIREDDVGVVAAGGRPRFETREEGGPPLPRDVVNGTTGIDEIEWAQRNVAGRVTAEPTYAHPVRAREPLGLAQAGRRHVEARH